MVGATFLDFFWSLLIIFFMVAFFMILFQVIGDLFRRDISGGKKALWIIFLIFVPFVGLLAYFITNGDGMGQRQMQAVQQAQSELDTHIRTVAGGSADEIAKAKALLDAGTITQAEFDQIKAKALS